MDPAFYLALIAAALGAASLVLHVIAPRTKTLVDDKLRDDIDDIDEALAFVRGNSKPQTDPAKLTALVVLLAVGLGGLGGLGATQLSCDGQSPRVVAAYVVTAELDCTAPALVGFVASLGRAGEAYLASKIAGDGRSVDTPAIKADLRTVASKAWSCAVTTALAALLNGPVARTLTGPPGPDPDALLAAAREVKLELGVAAVKTSAGVL